MTITRWIPKSSLMNYPNEFDRLFNSVFGSNPEAATNECYFCPEVDIEEQEKMFSVNVELPGVNKKDVSINVKDNVLTIEGEKKSAIDAKSDKQHRSERIYRKFKRSFRLPELVDQDKISATFIDGILNVSIPKLEEALPKQIEVKIK